MKSRNTIILLPLLAFLVLLLPQCRPDKKEEPVKSSAGSGEPELDQLNAQIAHDSKNPDALLKRAHWFNSHKRYSSALNDMLAATQIDSMRADLWMERGEAHFGLVQVQPAIDAFRHVTVLDPSGTAAFLKLAELSLYIKAYQESIGYANGALKNDPHNTKAYFIKGFVYKESGDTARSISSFQTCVETDPQDYDAYMQLGILYGSRGDKLALQYYGQALRLKPRSVEAYYDRAMFYQETADYNKAMEDYQALISIDPHYKQAYFNLGYIHLAYLKVYRQAIVHFTQALQCDSNYIEALYNRGISYENLGDVENAARDYSKALAIYPKYELARIGLKRVTSR